MVTLACGSAVIAVGILSWSSLRRARAQQIRGDDVEAAQNALFMARGGVMLSGLFLLVILAEAVPAFIQDPCIGEESSPVASWIARSGAALLQPRAAMAGVGPPGDLRGDAGWSDEPAILGPLALAALLYLRGAWSSMRRRSWQAAAFAGGLLTLAFALLSPLDALAGALFSAHMTQHLLLMTVAAPLLALAAPGAALSRGVPRGLRRLLPVRACAAGVRRAVTYPLTVWLLHALVVAAWHLPSLYGAALRSSAVHAVEHASLFGASLLFFQVLMRAGARGGIGHGAAVLYAFTASLGCGALGGLLALARVPLYLEHRAGAAAWGMGPLDDQQLAGVLMWVPGGAVYSGAALVLFTAWLRASERAARRLEIPPAPGHRERSPEGPCSE